MISSGNKVYGLEVSIQDTGKASFHFCFLELKKDTVQFLSAREQLSDISQLIPLLNKDFPVIVVFTGKHVLCKSTLEVLQPGIHHFFPGVSIKDFYFDVVSEEQESHAAIIRKSVVDYWINVLVKDINLLAVYWGHPLFFRCLPLLKQHIKSDTILLPTGSLYMRQNTTDSNSRVLQIGNDTMSPLCLLSYCAAFAFLTEVKAPTIDNKLLDGKQKAFEINKKMNRYATTYLGIVLLVLGLSTFASFYYQQKTDAIRAVSGIMLDKEMKDSLVTEISGKKAFLKGGNWDGKSLTTFYADRLAASIKGEIRLLGIQIHPRTVNDSEEELRFKSDEIIVMGLVADEQTLRNWTSDLSNEKWTKSTRIDSYQWMPEYNEGRFRIVIQLGKHE
jgi:hypothetical protein